MANFLSAPATDARDVISMAIKHNADAAIACEDEISRLSDGIAKYEASAKAFRSANERLETQLAVLNGLGWEAA